MKVDMKNKLLNRKLKPSKKNSGFTLLEAIAVLVLIAIAAVVAVKQFGKASDSQNSQNMIADINSMSSAVKSKFGSADDNYTSLTTASAITMNINSGTSVKTSGTTLKSQFSGGLVTITGDATNGQTFDISYQGVPTEVCQQVVAGVGGNTFQKITAGGTTVYDAIAGVAIKPSTTATACGKNSTVAMIFTAG